MDANEDGRESNGGEWGKKIWGDVRVQPMQRGEEICLKSGNVSLAKGLEWEASLGGGEEMKKSGGGGGGVGVCVCDIGAGRGCVP